MGVHLRRASAACSRGGEASASAVEAIAGENLRRARWDEEFASPPSQRSTQRRLAHPSAEQEAPPSSIQRRGATLDGMSGSI
jgi:hypothetical protein